MKIRPKTIDCIFMVMHIKVLLIDFLPFDVTKSYIHKFLPLLPKDYYLILSNGTKNFFRPNRTCMLIIKIDLSLNLLKISFGHNALVHRSYK